MSRLMAKPTIKVDNKFVKVTEWCFPPKSETGPHIHEMNYVVYILMKLLLRHANYRLKT